jgi:hypothetical protein
MKTILATIVLVATLLLPVASFAQTDYPLTAHIIGSQLGHRNFGRGAWACIYEFQINGIVYVTEGQTEGSLLTHFRCGGLLPTGTDVPALIKKDRLTVLINGKAIKLDIVGTHEGGR